MHEVVRELNPHARVVYVDYDPVVVSHGQALLAVTDLSIMVQGDLRRPAELLANPEVRAHLDFGQPVAIGLFAILHFLRATPATRRGRWRVCVAPSRRGATWRCLISAPTSSPTSLALAQAVAVYERASERVWPRSRDQILRFFDGFDLLEPGLVPKHQWRPVTGKAAVGTPNSQWARWGISPSPGWRTASSGPRVVRRLQ